MSRIKSLILFALVFAIVAVFAASEVMATLVECQEIQTGRKGVWYKICTARVAEVQQCFVDPDPNAPGDEHYVPCWETQITACQLTGEGGTCTSDVPEQLNMPICDCNPNEPIIVYENESHPDFKQAVGTGPSSAYVLNCEWWQFTFSAKSQTFSVFTNSKNPINKTFDVKVASGWYPVGPIAWIGCPDKQFLGVSSYEVVPALGTGKEFCVDKISGQVFDCDDTTTPLSSATNVTCTFTKPDGTQCTGTLADISEGATLKFQAPGCSTCFLITVAGYPWYLCL